MKSKSVPCVHRNDCVSAKLEIYKGKCYLTCPIYERRSGKERRRDVGNCGGGDAAAD